MPGPESQRPREAPAPKDAAKELASHRFTDFKARYERTIAAYFGTSDIKFTVEPGGWYIDLENLVVNADPEFFLKKGYTEAESLFATFHEAGHFLDMTRDQEEYRVMRQVVQSKKEVHPSYPQALFRLFNCLDDVMVNRMVMQRWRAGASVIPNLYRTKLFPNQTLNTSPEGKKQPKHRQLMYALLRNAMLESEPSTVDADVQTIIDDWQARGGEVPTLDILTGVNPMGQPHLSVKQRFGHIFATLVPIFEELYKQDLEDFKKEDMEEKGKGKGEKGKKEKGEKGENGEKGEKGEGEPEAGEGDPFGDDPFEDGIPDPMDYEDALDASEKINKKMSQKKKDAFKDALGVEQRDFESYQADYQKVKNNVQGLSQVFDKIIERKKVQRRTLNKSAKEGVLLDPRKAAIGYAEIRSGHFEPQIMLDYRRQERLETIPTDIEFTLICDGSGSMKDGKKEVAQRRLAVLFVEALNNFQQRLLESKRKGDDTKLSVSTEVRIFSDTDTVAKPMGTSMNQKDRVGMHKQLKNIPGGGNNEAATFNAIQETQFSHEKVKAMRAGKLKKVLLWLTDGESDATVIQEHIQTLTKAIGSTKEGKPPLVIAAIGFEGGQSAVTTYAPHGYYAESIDQVPKLVQTFIETILNDI